MRQIFVAFILCSVISVIINHVYISDIISNNDAKRKIENDNKFIRRHSIMRAVCPQSKKYLIKDMNVIEKAYHELEKFHNKGGNLKKIEKYLNWNIGKTLHAYEVKFIPSESNSTPVEALETVKYIHETLKQRDAHKRGGYDQRSLPGRYDPPLKGGSGSLRANNIRFDVHEPTSNFKRWEETFGPNMNSLCQNITIINMNGVSYEEKFMCEFDLLLKKDEKNSLHNDQQCNIVSIGSNGEWGFETYITDKTNCHTHTFDCTISKKQMEASMPKLPTVHPYLFCVADEDKVIEDREYLTYGSIANKVNMTNPPDLFKIDVEGFEYDFFTQMLNDEDAAYLLPVQISVELHYASRMYDLEWMLRTRQAGEITMFNGMMYNLGGYVPVHTKYMKGCDACVEVLYIRVFCE